MYTYQEPGPIEFDPEEACFNAMSRMTAEQLQAIANDAAEHIDDRAMARDILETGRHA